MAYKLQKYEDCACTRVKRFYASAHELAEALDYYGHSVCELLQICRNTDYHKIEV